MDLESTVYKMEEVHKFDVMDGDQLVESMEDELSYWLKPRPKSKHKETELTIEARIRWLQSSISFLKSTLTERKNTIADLEEKIRSALPVLNSAELRVFMAAINNNRSTKEIAQMVDYDEGYVRNLISSIKRKTGVIIEKL